VPIQLLAVLFYDHDNIDDTEKKKANGGFGNGVDDVDKRIQISKSDSRNGFRLNLWNRLSHHPPLWMSYEESYVEAFPFDKMILGILDSEMVEDTAKIVNEAQKCKVRVQPHYQRLRWRQRSPDRREDCEKAQFRKAAEAFLIPFARPMNFH